MKKSEVSNTHKENDQLFISCRLFLHLQLITRSKKRGGCCSQVWAEAAAAPQLDSGGAACVFMSSRRLPNATASPDFIEMKAMGLIHSFLIKAGAGKQVVFHSVLQTSPKAAGLFLGSFSKNE